MKRSMPWSDPEEDSTSDESSDSDSSSDVKANKKSKDISTKGKSSEVKSGKQKTSAVDFEALRQHGFKGGLSVLGVPAPKQDIEPNWSWSTGKDSGENKIEETYHDRQKTRDIASGEHLANVQSRIERKNISFAQKEKRKRDLGQASRGKNYVEEEKRLLRDSGVYSGFDGCDRDVMLHNSVFQKL